MRESSEEQEAGDDDQNLLTYRHSAENHPRVTVSDCLSQIYNTSMHVQQQFIHTAQIGAYICSIGYTCKVVDALLPRHQGV